MSETKHPNTISLENTNFLSMILESGVDLTGLMQSAQKRSNLVTFLAFGCPNFEVVNPTLPKGADLASDILGEDFISPTDVSEAYGFLYTDEHLAKFNESLPDLKMLNWLHKNGYILVAGPCSDTNLIKLRAFERSLFHDEGDGEGWWEKDEETFSRTDVVKGGQWLMLRKGDVPKSRSGTWKEQSKLVIGPERIPNATEVGYGATVYRKVRGVNILPNFLVRTSSVDSDGNHVFVGGQDDGGFCVNVYSDDFSIEVLGVSSARNL